MPPRRSARVVAHDPIILPGFGTQKDLARLTEELGDLPESAVEAVMRSEGGAAASCWADFMAEEGVAVDEAPAPAAAETTKRTYTFQKDTKKTKKSKPNAGVLVQAGTLDVTLVGRTKFQANATYHLPVPTRLPLLVTRVFTASHAVHTLAVGADGTTYGWGRNETGALGSDLPTNVFWPTALKLPGSSLKQAACGKGHTVILLEDDGVWSVGSNKSGQCGVRTYTDVPQWRSAPLPDDVQIAQIACGEDFTVALDTEGRLYTTGSSEHGQLGNGETGEYFIAANKLAFANCNVLTQRTTFCHAPGEKLHGSSDSHIKIVPLEETDIRLQAIACGKHHTVAVEACSEQKPRVFTWGSGDYGCLGHGVQAPEYFPRLVGALSLLTKAQLSSDLKLAAGARCNLLQTSNGHVYYWGKHRSMGEAVMRPQLVDVLANNQHEVLHVGAGSQSVVCSTSLAQTVAWGQGPHGELGLGTVKSSSKPTFVEPLNGCQVMDLACGYGNTVYVLQNDTEEEKNAVAKLPEVQESDVDLLAKRLG